ncbi:hypothetical protein Z948_920 [Sulfitobacter donghicola DSW-25 = KCTC 12864 = JCM 14565]|nr:hypothetical protein Z948_920 [Sulfitobacter donghicola DSW-25 = KCTC 12864 = JCM 14565]
MCPWFTVSNRKRSLARFCYGMMGPFCKTPTQGGVLLVLGNVAVWR